MIVSAATEVSTNRWLAENGATALESLLRTIVFHPSVSLLVTNDERVSLDASVGAGKLLGLPRERIIGRRLDDFAESDFRQAIAEDWEAFLQKREHTGRFRLRSADGTTVEVEYTAKADVLPARHLLLIHDSLKSGEWRRNSTAARVQDFALLLLDTDGQIVSWHAGAERTYQYNQREAVGRHLSVLLPSHGEGDAEVRNALKRAVREGRFASEGWHLRKDASRFWANTMTAPLNDEHGVLQGFATIVRDFSDRHDRDEKLRSGLARARPLPAEPTTIAGVVSGEFERILEANDTFLELLGYTRADLAAGRLVWPNLTPKEYEGLDEVAHEEGLLCGACSPFEKELIRKDGTHVPVSVTTAVMSLTPFRWITFVADLRERNGKEQIEERGTGTTPCFEEMIGSSPALKRVTSQVALVAPTDATVLILGETGTGKELVARSLHRMSPRKNFPFITLNCAAIPTGLLESELFGHERGAFTGALAQKLGRFELANHGTLFLDEVGDIPLDLQPKLLRALQEKSFERLGGVKTIPIDVRLVAATNRDLTQMMGDKLFRSDLYYRLKVFPIVTPPLRDRPEDIPILARHFTRKYAEKMSRTIETIPLKTMKALVNWRWPGNVRELENFIERSVILSPDVDLRAPVDELRASPGTGGGGTLDEMERAYIIRVLEESGGVVSAAAIRLGLPRTSLNALMTRLGISRNAL